MDNSASRSFNIPRPVSQNMVDFKQFENFTYSTLNRKDREIRLISISKLQPGEPEDTPTQCSLITKSLNSKPHYLTLSYVWGDLSSTSPIFLNGKLFYVTGCLDVALQHLRDFNKARDQYIWIDALCINQNDEREKSWQVHMMRDIFRDAALVIAWLGPLDEDADVAFGWLELRQRIESGDFTGESEEYVEERRAEGNNLNGHEARCFQDIWSRPWFRRLWILQEFALAKEAEFLCGHRSIDWKIFDNTMTAVSSLLGKTSYQILNGSKGETELATMLGELDNGWWKPLIFELRHELQDDTTSLSLWSLLIKSKLNLIQATEPRDMIYGLLGLVEDSESSLFVPDYSLTIQESFISTSKKLLLQGHLRVLLLSSYTSALSGLPSWTPDWSYPWGVGIRTLCFSLCGSSFKDDLQGSEDAIFNASLGSMPSFEFKTYIASIEAVTWRLYDSGHSEEVTDQQRMRNGLRALLSLSDTFAPYSPESAEAAIRTLLFDRLLSVDARPNFMSKKMTKDPRRVDSRMIRKWIEYLTSNLEEGFEPGEELNALASAKMYRHKDRKPFITSKGNLGIGPMEVASGDEVVVFFGAEVPSIIRKEDDGFYRLIGGAYVHGIMDGEAMKGKYETKMFELC